MTFSAVLTLHDRPHSLRWVRRYAEEICNVCPSCEFRALPDEPTAACERDPTEFDRWKDPRAVAAGRRRSITSKSGGIFDSYA